MRTRGRATLTILAAAVLVLTVLIGAAASAATPDFCDPWSPKYNADHPTCDATPPDTTTTTAAPQLAACTTIMTISGTGNTSFDCLWTPESDVSATEGTVTVSNIEGGIKKAPVVFVLDDFPGDICVLEQSWVAQPGHDYEVSFDLVYGDTLPEGYEAWQSESYWGFIYDPLDPTVGAHWCAPQDPAFDSIRADTNGTPLHLRVVFNAGKGGSLDIELSPGQG